MNRASFFAFSAAVATVFVLPASPVEAQEEEARLLFEQGNEHLARGMRRRGRRRAAELQQALDAYLGCLRLDARTRNVVFNLGLTLQELGREPEAFNYYSQYLTTFELSDEDRAEGERRIEMVRPNVAVVSIRSTPDGADVRVDRRDLPVRGQTPLDLALPEGEHTIFITRDGYLEGTATATVANGQTAQASVELAGEPVPVQFIAPGGGQLTLDGEVVEAGRAIPVPPGAHVVRLELPGAPPVERSFEIAPGAEPLTLELSAVGGVTHSRMALNIDVPSSVFLDGVGVGHGRRVETPVPPGEHVVRVESPGYNAAAHRFTLQPAQALSMSVSMGEHPDSGGLDAARVTTTLFASLGAVTSAFLIGLSFDLRAQWDSAILAQDADGSDEAELRAIADDLEGMTIGADVAVSATVVLGTLAIVFLAISSGDDVESTVEVAAAPTLGGATLAVRGRVP